MNGYNIREVLGKMVSAGEDWQVTANLLHSLGYAEAHVRYLGGPVVTLEAKFTEMTPAWLTLAARMQPVQDIVEHLVTRNLTGEPSFGLAQVGVNVFHVKNVKNNFSEFCSFSSEKV